MDLQAQLEREVQEHNELHANIQAGEEQLEAMKADKARRLGRIQVLQEVLQDAALAEEDAVKQEDTSGESAEE